MNKFVSKSIEDTAKIAIDWLRKIVVERVEVRPPRSDLRCAYVVGLSGHLGAGKTAFVKCVAKELGIEEEVTSPTFVIMKIYDIDTATAQKKFGSDFRWTRLVHIDAYRLEKQEVLSALNFESVVSDPHNLVLVEWPENVGIARQYPHISFGIDAEGERVIEIN